MHYCSKCNNPLIWQSDFSVEDVLYLEQYPEAVDGVVSYYYCPVCDRLEVILYNGDIEVITDMFNIN